MKMKKHLILLVIAGNVIGSAFAQKKEKEADDNKGKKITVPAMVKQAFARQHAGTVAKWEKEDGKYEAAFKDRGHEMSVLYEANGAVAETEIQVNVKELPAAAINYVRTNYKDAKIKEASKITKADGTVNYEAEVKGEDLVFDSKGNFIRKEKD
jgi:hypothetical protein